MFFTPIGNRTQREQYGRPFSGKFDGGGHVIRNLSITNSGECAGFFGTLASGALVEYLGLENVSVLGYDKLGGLAGFNMGVVSQCYVTGKVETNKSASNICGGFIGKNIHGQSGGNPNKHR